MSLLARSLRLPCGLELPNRFAKAAMSEQLAEPDCSPGVELERLYRRWAAGGAGLLITGNVMVDRRALGEKRNVALDEQTPPASLERWAEAAKSGGSRVLMQLNHPGRQSPRALSPVPVAPSAVKLRTGGIFATPRALEPREIQGIVDAFARAAEKAMTAGFHGVELHCAHGYLANQFLSPLSNLREDDWGGSLENRARFLLSVVTAVRKRIGASAALAVKLNSADFQRGGFAEDDALMVGRWLGEAGIDLLELSGGTYESAAMMGPARASTVAREAYFLEFAERMRKSVTLPLMLTGGFRTRAAMEGALAANAIDVVGLARPMAVDPELPRRLLDGSTERPPTPVPKSGIRTLDSANEMYWHQMQLQRMGRGDEPDLSLGLFAVTWTLLRESSASIFSRKRGL